MKSYLSLTQKSLCLLAVVFTILLSACKNKTQDAGNFGSTGNGKDKFTDTSSSSVRVYDDNGRLCIQQSNTYYQLVDFYKGQQKVSLLLKINKIELCMADSVNKHKVFKISARNLSGDDIHWETEFTGTNLDVKDNTLLVTHEGVDTEEDYLKRFSLLDGKEVFACSYGEMMVKIPNVKERRFVGYTSSVAATEPIKKMNKENLFAIIEYSSGNALINRLAVTLHRSKVSDKVGRSTPEMLMIPDNSNTSAIENGKTLALMKAGENYTSADIKEFSVQYTFYFGDDNESTIILIPVVGDHLDLKNAKYDKEIFSLEEVAVDKVS